MTVYEIECRQVPTEEGAEPIVISLYANSKAEAMRMSADPETTGELVEPPTIYQCTLATTTPVQTVLDLLNDRIEPVRQLLVHGSLPLPMRSST